MCQKSGHFMNDHFSREVERQIIVNSQCDSQQPMTHDSQLTTPDQPGGEERHFTNYSSANYA